AMASKTSVGECSMAQLARRCSRRSEFFSRRMVASVSAGVEGAVDRAREAESFAGSLEEWRSLQAGRVIAMRSERPTDKKRASGRIGGGGVRGNLRARRRGVRAARRLG